LTEVDDKLTKIMKLVYFLSVVKNNDLVQMKHQNQQKQKEEEEEDFKR